MSLSSQAEVHEPCVSLPLKRFMQGEVLCEMLYPSPSSLRLAIIAKPCTLTRIKHACLRCGHGNYYILKQLSILSAVQRPWLQDEQWDW